MKKCLFLIIICIPLVAIEQVTITDDPNYKPINVEGIGRFKIDQTTTSVVDSISKENAVPVTKTLSPLGSILETMGTINAVVSIYELERDSRVSNSDAHAMMQNDVRVFYLNYYDAGYVSIHNIFLKFYRDTLIEFACNPTPSTDDSTSIGEAFRKRYGQPGSVVTNKKAIVCRDENGTQNNYEESFTSFFWIAENKTINVFEYIDTSYPDCKEKTSHVFSIADDTKNKIVEENEKRLKGESGIK
jgi:hypothetical protein